MTNHSDGLMLTFLFSSMMNNLKNISMKNSLYSNQRIFRYLNLLNFSLQKAVNLQSVLTQLCTQDDCSFVPNVMKTDAKNIKALFQLLETFLSKGVRLQTILSVLNIKDEDGCNVGNILARYQNEQLNQLYINFLLNLYRKGLDGEAIIASLQNQSNLGMTSAMWLIKNNLLNSSNDYLQLLKLFLDEGEDLQEVHSLMMLNGKATIQDKAKNIVQLMIDGGHIALLYKTLSSGLLPDEALNQLRNIKPMIADYILKITNRFFKKNALRDALDLSNSLGRLFNNFYFYSSVARDLKSELERMETADKRRWAVKFFPQAKTTEIDSYLYLLDPYQAKLKK